VPLPGTGTTIRPALRRTHFTVKILRARSALIFADVRRAMVWRVRAEAIPLRPHRIVALMAAVERLHLAFPRRTVSRTIATLRRRLGAGALASHLRPALPSLRRRTRRPAALRALIPLAVLFALRAARFGFAITITLPAGVVARRFPMSFLARLRPALLAALALGTRLAVAIARRLSGLLIRLRATRLRAFPARRRRALARTAEFIGPQPAIAIAIHFAEHFRRLGNLLRIDRAVVVGIERIEKPRHRALAALPVFAVAFRAERGRRARTAFGTRSLRRTRRLVFLSAERPRRQRERDRGDEHGSWLHKLDWLGFWRRTRRRVGSMA
jgi:hypothetical protein